MTRDINIGDYTIQEQNSDLRLQHDPSGSQIEYDENASSWRVRNSDFRLDTGQAIEDGGGTDRLRITSSRTEMIDNGGDDAIQLIDGLVNQYIAESGQSFVVRDGEGGFNGLAYITSASSPGTLSLDNSTLSMSNNRIEMGGTFSSAAISWPDQGGGNTPEIYADSNGEIIAVNDDGQATQLT
jgi:hypothetical protein